jgi:hypothetical protein
MDSFEVILTEGEHMTEEEYQRLTEFNGLPLYEADDPAARSVDTVRDPRYDGVYEAESVDQARAYLANAAFQASGGIRYVDEEGVMIRAYFWKKR